MTAEPLDPKTDLTTSRIRWFAAAFLPLAAAAASLAVSWLCWINPLIDSPREMAVASRIADGERLYADVVYYYGPIGPWVSGLAVGLFGHRFLVLEILASTLAVAALALLFVLTRRAGSAASALAATTAAAAICFGAPLGGAFVFPYSSASLFALAAGLLALVGSSGRPSAENRVLTFAGLTISLLSRGEIGVAAAVVLLVAALRSKQSRRSAATEVAVIAAAVTCAAGIYALCFAGTSVRELIADGPFKHYVGLSQQWREFYLTTAGLAQPAKTFSQLGLALLLDLAILGLAAWLLPPRERGSWWRRWAFPLIAGTVFVVYCCSSFSVTSKNLPPVLLPLPLVAGGAALWLLRHRLDPRARSRFLLFAFSAAVASRVILNLHIGPRMSPYCAAPLPGLLAVAAVLLGDLLATRVPAPDRFRRRLAALLVAITLLYLYRIERLHWHEHLVRLETAAGPLRLPAREALPIAYALHYLSLHSRPGETLAGFPESGFFNFIEALKNPLREDHILPGQLDARGEQEVADRLVEEGPRFVLLCNRPTSEYGATAFGLDYADHLWSEVESHYALTGTFGARATAPIGAGHFFVRIYERSPWPEPPQLLARFHSPSLEFGAHHSGS